MKTRLFALLCLLGISLSLAAQWSKQGLHQLSIYEMKHRADTLYACTNDGIYVRHAFQPDDPWQAIGLQGKSISNLFFGTDNRMLAHELSQTPLQSTIHIADQDGFEVLAVQDADYNRAPYFRCWQPKIHSIPSSTCRPTGKHTTVATPGTRCSTS